MKLKCIDEEPVKQSPNSLSGVPIVMPRLGEIYTPIGEDHRDGYRYFLIQELDNNFFYIEKYFEILGDDEESEFDTDGIVEEFYKVLEEPVYS